MPYLRIQRRSRYTDVFVDPADVVAGTPADEFGFVVQSTDHDFARAFVTRQLIETIAAPQFSKPVPPIITFANGTMRMSPRTSKRFKPETILETADILAAVAQTIPRQAWTPPQHRQA